MRGLGRRILPLLRPLRDAGRWPLYLLRLLLGRPAGDYSYRYSPPSGGTEGDPLRVEVRLAAEGDAAVEAEAATAWCARQTLGSRRPLGELTAAGYDRSGRRLWQVDSRGRATAAPAGGRAWFTAPGSLPEVGPAFLESCLLVAAAEQVDAVALLERLPSAPKAGSITRLETPALRPYCLFSSTAYRYDAATGDVEPRTRRRLVKVVTGGAETARSRLTHHRRRRGPYLSSSALPPLLQVGLRDLPARPRGARHAAPTSRNARRRSPGGGKTGMLVTAPFLARGGAEHTLFETARALSSDFEIAIATLAPHRPELGDRRDDFHQITRRIYCLGDLVHPAAMPAILGRLLDQLGVETLYNANGTTLFYEFGPRLKAERPGLRVVDHLYDHRIGYIDRYADPDLRTWIDACVAENHRIAEVLVEELGWPRQRVPVIWPCGRSAGAFPQDPAAARREVRRELELRDSDLVVLTAARMHPQKRPLDLVALADRVRDLDGIHFLLVGGGDLEPQVDAAIAAADGAPVRRLPFRTDIPRLIAAADAGCLISEHEGLPVFLLECLQAGRPFLGTDAGEMAAVLRATGAGLVTGAPGDLDAIEAAVRRLYDPEVRGELAGRAAEAADRFDVESCAARYAEVLRGVSPPDAGGLAPTLRRDAPPPNTELG